MAHELARPLAAADCWAVGVAGRAVCVRGRACGTIRGCLPLGSLMTGLVAPAPTRAAPSLTSQGGLLESGVLGQLCWARCLPLARRS